MDSVLNSPILCAPCNLFQYVKNNSAFFTVLVQIGHRDTFISSWNTWNDYLRQSTPSARAPLAESSSNPPAIEKFLRNMIICI